MDTQMWIVLVAVLVGIIIFLVAYLYLERSIGISAPQKQSSKHVKSA